MSIDVSCPACGEEYELPPKAAGRTIRCKECHTPITVPEGRKGKKSGADSRKARLPPKRNRAAEQEPKKKEKSRYSSGLGQSTTMLSERDAGDDAGDLAADGIGLVLRGVVCIALGAIGYFAFWAMESDGGGGRVPIIFLLIYRLGGKFLIALLFGGAGLFFIGAGGVQIYQSRDL